MIPRRVVLFCGQVPDPGALALMEALERDPRVDVVGAFAQSSGFGLKERLRDLWRRRRWVAVPLLIVQAAEAAHMVFAAPLTAARDRRRRKSLFSRIEVVHDLHSPDVLGSVRDLAADLGLVYGAPILKPELFQIPRLGSLGIHHGRVPEYRGKKTTFWAMYNGEPTVGVTIQRLNAGIDTGEVVLEGEVEVRGRSYRSVSRELDVLGVEIFHRAIIEVLDGRATFSPQRGPKGRLYRDPEPRDLARFWWGRVVGKRQAKRARRPTSARAEGA